MAGFKTHKLETPLQAYNVDGTENKRGTIKTYVSLELEINGRKTNTDLLVTGLGKERIILGFPWLNEHNPDINWKTGEFSWRETSRKQRFLRNVQGRKPHPCGPLEHAKKLARQALGPKQTVPKPSIEEIPDEDEWKNKTINPTDNDTDLLISYIMDDMDKDIWINSKSTTATRIQAEINLQKKVLPLEEQVPIEFHEFLDVFSEEKVARFPDPRPWDHKIKMKDTFVPKSFKT